MRVGLVVPNTWSTAVESVVQLGPLAEEWDYDSVWVTDHVVGVRAFAPVYGPYWIEALTALAYLASATTKVRLGTSILVAPYRDPVYTAKVLTSIDHLSGGRLDIGVGVGWSRSEYRALGRAAYFEHRGSATTETLEIMTRCFEGGELEFSGEHFQFGRIDFAPPSLQQPHPPLWIAGGESRVARERIARFADLWHPANLPPAEVAARGDQLDEVAQRKVARGPRFAVAPDDAERVPDRLAEYADAGCAEAIVEFRPPPGEGEGSFESTRRCAERLAEQLRVHGRP